MQIAPQTQATWKAFLTAHARVTKAINRDLAEAGLPDLSWYHALRALQHEDGRLRIRKLADAVGLSSTGCTRLVDRLQAAGTVRREEVPGDRRGAYAVLTDEGAALLERMWPVYSRGIATYFAPALDAQGGLRPALERISEPPTASAA
jgi:DNA-binding MarR family transcriptional regulator